MHPSLRDKDKGFTFFEVMFISVVLSLGLLTIIEVFPLGFKAKEAAEQYSLAALLGQGIMEEVRREGYASLSGLSLSQNGNRGMREGEFDDFEGCRYRLEWFDSDTAGLRKLVVTITFSNQDIKSSENETKTRIQPGNGGEIIFFDMLSPCLCPKISRR